MNRISTIDIEGQGYPIGGEQFDDGWVQSFYTILASSTIAAGTGSVTYSLDDYLPKDDFNYQVVVIGGGTTPATKGARECLVVFPGTVTPIDYRDPGGLFIGDRVARTAAAVTMGGSVLLPIFANDRNVTLLLYNATTASNYTFLFATGYRRLGKNE